MLIEAVRYLEADELSGNCDWRKFVEPTLTRLSVGRPPTETDLLIDSHDPTVFVEHPIDLNRTKDQPRVFTGPIASANKLLKNPIMRDELRDKFHVKAVEMEASGIADAMWNAAVGYLIVRGICDYFDANKGDLWQKYAAVVAAAYTRVLIGSLPTKVINSGSKPDTSEKFDSQSFCIFADIENDGCKYLRRDHLLDRLLTFIWGYPLKGGSRKSWAIKDSALMLEKQPDAIEKPSLGVAIVSTHFAKEVFGYAAQSRVEDCVRWALSHSQLAPPHLIQVEEINQITYRRILEVDYRHTISLGIVLARWGLHFDLQELYLEMAFNSQKEAGGWQAENSYPLSEIFTVLYSVEFLDLCSRDNRLSSMVKEKACVSRDDGIEWIVKDIGQRPLWGSGIMKEYAWDELWTSSRIIQRLISAFDKIPDQLLCCIKRALQGMMRGCNDADTWLNSTEAQVFRVKARVAAAVAISKERLHANY